MQGNPVTPEPGTPITPPLYAYGHNPFRLSGLPVNAVPRRVRRRTEELKAAAELGGDDARARGLLGVAMSPTETLEAVRHLSDPVSRLHFEFGWLWPHPDGTPTPVEVTAAKAMWTSMLDGSARERAVAVHNLAVEEHVRLLEGGDPLGDLDGWRQIYTLWTEVCDDDEVWRWLDERVDAINDPRLQYTHASDIRDNVGAWLVESHATTVIAAVGEETEALHEHRTVMEVASLDSATVNRGLATAVEPQATRLRALVERIKTGGHHIEHHRRATEELLDAAAGPDVGVLRDLLPDDHPVAGHVLDELALTIRTHAVAMANHPGSQNSASQALAGGRLTVAAALSVGPHALATIREDEATLTANEIVFACEEAVEAVKGDPDTGLDHYDAVDAPIDASLRLLESLNRDMHDRVVDAVDEFRAIILMEYLLHTRDEIRTLPRLRRLHASTGNRQLAVKLAQFVERTEQTAGDEATPPTTVEHPPVPCSVCSRNAGRSRRLSMQRRNSGGKERHVLMVPLCERHIGKSLSLIGFSEAIRAGLLVLFVAFVAWALGIALPATVVTIAGWATAALVVFSVPRRIRRLTLVNSPRIEQLLQDGWRIRG